MPCSRLKLPEDFTPEVIPFMADPFKGEVQHNYQRKAALVKAGPVDHQKNVYFIENPNFDLNKTIFQSVSGLMGLRRLIIKAKLCNDFAWKNEAAQRIKNEYEVFEREVLKEGSSTQDDASLKVPRSVEWDEYSSLLAFMRDECDFKTEHADGSFMDHLYFCRDYSTAHYKQQSPRVLFLHSILGVGTVSYSLCCIRYLFVS